VYSNRPPFKAPDSVCRHTAVNNLHLHTGATGPFAIPVGQSHIVLRPGFETLGWAYSGSQF
jgi:hypothetical protein